MNFTMQVVVEVASHVSKFPLLEMRFFLLALPKRDDGFCRIGISDACREARKEVDEMLGKDSNLRGPRRGMNRGVFRCFGRSGWDPGRGSNFYPGGYHRRNR